MFFYDNVNYDLHFHKNYEIIYVVSGNVACSVNSKTKILSGGEQAVTYKDFISPVFIMNAIDRSLASGREVTVEYKE